MRSRSKFLAVKAIGGAISTYGKISMKDKAIKTVSKNAGKIKKKAKKTVRSASSRGAAISAGLKKYYRNKKRSIGRKLK